MRGKTITSREDWGTGRGSQAEPAGRGGLAGASAGAPPVSGRPSTIQTGPRANVIGWPDAVRKVVPSSAAGRDQRAWKTSPSRSTSARPEPTLFANGVGACGPVAGGIVTWVYWMTTVAADSCPSSVLAARDPSIQTSQRPRAADQVKRNEAAG